MIPNGVVSELCINRRYIYHSSHNFNTHSNGKKPVGQRIERQLMNERFINFRNTEFYVKGRRKKTLRSAVKLHKAFKNIVKHKQNITFS